MLALPDLYGTFDVSIVGVSWTITAYNIAIVVGALAVLPLERRVRGHVFAGIGLAVFAVASLGCGLANSFEVLIVGRTLQGFGAALALAGLVPVLAGIRGSDAHAIAMWGVAGTIGAALGPALGGFLTQLFSWRSIFLLQAPLAAIALVAVLDPRVRAVEIAPRRGTGGARLAREHRVPRALRRARRRAVPLGAAARRGVGLVADRGRARRQRLAGRRDRRAQARAAPPRTVRGRPGGVALAGGLVALAFLPAATGWWAAPALFACGLGLGLLGGVLGPAAVPPTEANVRAATISIAARHAGFVLGLAVIAPVLATHLDTAALDATRATTAEVLDADVSLRTKVTLALDLRDLVGERAAWRGPDPSVPFDKRGAADNANLRETRDGVVDAIRDTLTRAFRVSFLIAALFGAAAALAAALLPAYRAGPRHVDALTAAVAVIVLVVVLIAAEFRAGAQDFGTRDYVGPVTRRPIRSRRAAASTARCNASRCRRSTAPRATCTRAAEELILSLDRSSDFGPEVTWTQATLEEALRAGLDPRDRRRRPTQHHPGLVARGLKVVAERAPIDWILGRLDIPFLEN